MEPERAHLYFDNGYGVSIQKSEHHHSGTTSHEVAVLHRTSLNGDFHVCSMTDVAPDGIKGWLNGEGVAVFIHQVQALKPRYLCEHTRRET
jgi:hypothetical protein